MARKDVQTRIRLRIRARLDELGMTARELARDIGHDDAWISGILKGSQGLHWKDLDAVADKLGLAPSELVRHDDAVLRELTPREMELLRHYQGWPIDQQDHWIAVLKYFHQIAPDAETGALLGRLQALPRVWRRSVLDTLVRVLEGEIPPELLTGGVTLSAGEVPTEPTTKPRRHHGESSTEYSDRRRRRS